MICMSQFIPLTTWRRTVFRSLQLPPGSICVLLFVISWRYRLTASARNMVVGLSQLPAPRRGTHCQHTFVVWRTAPLHLDDYLRLICFLSTSVYSEFWVSAIMRYINRRFTYLLKGIHFVKAINVIIALSLQKSKYRLLIGTGENAMFRPIPVSR